jgi:hypothetical protein
MCTNKNNFAARGTQTKLFSGVTEIPANQVQNVSDVQFFRLFPQRVDGYTTQSGTKKEPLLDNTMWSQSKWREVYKNQALGALDPNRKWGQKEAEEVTSIGVDSWVERKMQDLLNNGVSSARYLIVRGSPPQPIDRVIRWQQTEKPTICGSKCRSAKGPNCDCICEGKFHGSGSVFARSKDSITMTPKKSPHSRFARSSASTKALHTIYNYLEVVRTEWGEDRGIEAGRELQKAAKAIAADPSSQDIAAEIAQLVRVATTDKSYDKRDRALDDLESIINQAQSQHARRKGKTSMARISLADVNKKVAEYAATGASAKAVSDYKRRLLAEYRSQDDVYISLSDVNKKVAEYAATGASASAVSAFKADLLVQYRGSNEGFSRTRKGKTSMAQADFKVGDKVHLGFASKGAVGFDGVITKIDSETVYIQSPEIGQYGPRTFKGPVRFLSHGFAGYYTEHSRSGVKSLMQKEYVLWGVPEGETDQLHAKVLSTQAKTPSEMDEIKRRASAAGWHSFRVQILDPDKPTRMFSRSGSRSRMGSGDPYMENKDVKVRKGVRSDTVAFVGQNGGGGDFYAGLEIRPHSGNRFDNQLLWMKHSYATAAAAERSAIKKFDDHVARGGYSRNGAKATFEAGDSFMVEGYVGEMITGGRSARTMEEAEHYANAMLAMIKRNAGGKPVKVEIQEIKAYSPQGVIKTMHSRGKSEISTRFGSIASKLGFLPDSITESNGVATLKFAQADGSAGRCAFAMIRPLTGIVGSDRVTATDTEVRVQFARRDPTKSGVSLDPYTTEQGIELRDGTMVDAKRVNGRWSIPSLPEVGGSRTFQSLVDMVTAWEGRSTASRSGGKATFGSDVILEDIGEDQVRATARVEGRSAGSFDGPRSQSAQLLLKALKIAGQGHEVSSGVYDMTHITLNDAAKRAMPKSAMMSRGGKAEFAMEVGDTVKVKQGGKTVSGKIIKLPNATDLENGQYLIELPNQLYNDGRVTRELVPANRILMSRARFGQENQQIADGVAQLLSVLGLPRMAEGAKMTTDADTLRRYINVARRRIRGSDQSDRFNTLADKLERMLMSRGGGKAEFGEIGSGGSYVSNALHHISNDIARGDKDMAKAMMRKLAERIGKESHTDAEWHQYLSLARSLGFSDNAVAGFSRGDEKSESLKKLLSQNVSRSNLAQMEKVVDTAITYAKKVGDDELLDLAEETGIECSALRSRASRLGTKTRFEMDQTTHRHLMTWIDNQLGNRAGSAGYIADKMIGTFNDDPEHWENQGWSKVFSAAGLSSADLNNPKKGWD